MSDKSPEEMQPEKLPEERLPEKPELVVAWTARDLIVEHLRGLGLRSELGEHDDVLGLGLIKFDLPDNFGERDNLPTFSRQPITPLDRLVVRLRNDFADKYRGWVPAIGKNRPLGSVASANGQFGGGGAGEPQPVPTPKLSPNAVRSAHYRPAAAHTGRGARVAVLDTRLASSPGLEGKVWAPPITYLRQARRFKYELGHATYVNGLIALKAPGAQLRTTAVLTEQNATTDAWTVAKAMAKLASSDVQVLNMSMGCFTEDNRPPFVLRRAVEVLNPQIVIVAAAGNHREPENPAPFWPAALDNVIAVGAYDDKRDKVDDKYPRAYFSPQATWVDLEAPGVEVVSLYLDGQVDGFKKSETPRAFTGMASWEGTSAAAATVSGTIAAELKQGVTAADVVQRMRKRQVGEVYPYDPDRPRPPRR